MQKLIKTNGKFIEIDCFKIKMVILTDGLKKIHSRITVSTIIKTTQTKQVHLD